MRRYQQLSAPTGSDALGALRGRNLESQVTRDYHRIEKGLALRDPRRPFGVAVRNRLELLLQNEGSESEYGKNAESALQALEEWNERGQIDASVSPKYVTLPASSISQDELTRFFKSRKSIRTYISTPVPEDQVRQAVELAQHTPSVCNRQPWRVHVYHGEYAQKVLGLHNGSAAFAKNVPSVAVITVDAPLFGGSGERNQRWIDGGLFAMSFVWALHGLGISTCMLNWSRSNDDSDRLRVTAGIPESEDVITLLAFGFANPEARVARSPIRPTTAVFVSH
ncbi:nitroreductase family protein [Antiquaquibacter oligotrophicus]|nr:nitroreductase family protein [Antiquaquibacter oligotrophicus]